MMEELKTIFLAGIGLTSTSMEKAEKMINDMVEKGRMTVQEGKELQSELTRRATSATPVTKQEMASFKTEVELMGFAKKEEVAALAAKVDELTIKVNELLTRS